MENRKASLNKNKDKYLIDNSLKKYYILVYMSALH